MKRVWNTAGKMITAAVGCLAMAVASGAAHGNVLAIANGVIAFATVVGVYHAPYATTSPPPAP